VIDAVMEEFRKFSPNGLGLSLMSGMRSSPHQLILLKAQRPEGRILAVVGAGHRREYQIILTNHNPFPRSILLPANQKSFPWGKVFGFGVTAIFFLLLLQ